MRVVTDAAEITLRGFDVRQALELPDLLFTFSRARGPQGEPEFLFLGRGWGHGVVPASTVNASAAPSLR
jgi:hypothetical protein